jgi:ribosomal protein S18 acetylase RimI-like enzyme
MTPPIAPARLLDWDTEFWGHRIAIVEQFSETVVPLLDGWASDQRIECLYLRLAPSAFPNIHLAESLGFRLMDIRMDFRRGIGQDLGTAGGDIGLATVDDIPDLVLIAREAHTDSRFFVDPRFPDATCRDFYAQWVTNSVNGYADAVLVARVDGTIVGYITGHFDSGTGRIGLIAVAQEQRGCGIGLALERTMAGLFAAAGLSSVRVATQGSNLPARRFYEHRGFSLDDIQLTFHRWITDG